MNTLYALIVGINDYPASTRLKGCLHDVEAMQAMLQRFFADRDQHIRTLVDAEATHEAVVTGFREHLGRAGADDVVFFHFSGHGTESPTAEEFRPFEHTGMDQALVCFDSRPRGLLLADKELAVLLHEVATRLPDGGAKAQPPHIVVSLDCCHSGSGTRDLAEDPLMLTRSMFASADAPRRLETYLDGHYRKQLDAGRPLSVPASPHVVLTACENIQKAGDTPTGGVFTQSLVRAVKSESARINYSDLLVRARAYARRLRDHQNPQFASFGRFNPYTRFLDGAPEGSPDRREVFFARDTEAWYVRYGAIHGLPSDTKDPVEVEIRALARDPEPTAVARLHSVGALQSRLDLPDGAGLDPDTSYWGTLRHLPAPPAFVWVHGDDDGVALLKTHWDASKNIRHVDARDDPRTPTLEVEARDRTYHIRALAPERLIATTEGEADAYTAPAAESVVRDLGKIVRWRRTVELANPKSRIADWATFELEVYEYRNGQRQATPETYTGTEIKLYLSEDNADEEGGTFFIDYHPFVRVHHDAQDLYFYLLFLNSDYSIGAVDEEKKYLKGESDARISLSSNEDGFGLRPDVTEDEAIFKLLVTTEELDYEQLFQPPLELLRLDRVERRTRTPARLFEEWAAQTMRVTLVRQDHTLGPDHDVDLGGGALRIRKHPGVRAKAVLVRTPAPDRSHDPAAGFARFHAVPGFRQLGLGSDRANAASHVLELTDLKVEEGALDDQPLELVLPGPPAHAPDEVVLPVAFDGDHFRVVGDSTVEDGATIVHIRDLPEPSPMPAGEGGRVVNPFGEDPEDASLFEALKMAFFRLTLHRTDRPRLCAARFGEDGAVTRDGEDRPAEERHAAVRERVERSERILLLVHGLTGDTQGMAEGVGRALGLHEDATGVGPYDLVLTFDYDTLHTPIPETAVLLRDALAAVGLDADDGKTLTLLAHSLGGLVGRWFVERLGGDRVVDRLILAGTPNAGSLFDSLDAYRHFAALALEIALNYLAPLIPAAGTLLVALQRADGLPESLGQMGPDAPFLRDLNQAAAPPIPYTVLEGDVSAYEQAEAERTQAQGFGRLVDKATTDSGDRVRDSQPDDLAVGRDSMVAPLAGASAVRVACHHLNYFHSTAGLEALRGALSI